MHALRRAGTAVATPLARRSRISSLGGGPARAMATPPAAEYNERWSKLWDAGLEPGQARVAVQMLQAAAAAQA